MQNPTSIKQIIQALMPKQNEIIIGKVVSENPLKVQAENDAKLELNVRTLIIPKTLHDNPLKCGEKIHILVFNDAKKYYALDRVVM